MVWMNERRQVRIYRTLTAAQSAVVQNVSPKTADESNDLELVHMQGELEAATPLVDQGFQLALENCVRLERKVEMYQWVEKKTERDQGGGMVETHFEYETGWFEHVINSAAFREATRHNPTAMPCSSISETNEVTIGDFTLSSTQTSQLNHFQELDLEQEEKKGRLMSGAKAAVKPQQYYDVRREGNVIMARHSMQGFDEDATGQIGQLRISWRWVPCTSVTLVAQ